MIRTYTHVYKYQITKLWTLFNSLVLQRYTTVPISLTNHRNGCPGDMVSLGRESHVSVQKNSPVRKWQTMTAQGSWRRCWPRKKRPVLQQPDLPAMRAVFLPPPPPRTRGRCRTLVLVSLVSRVACDVCARVLEQCVHAHVFI